MAVSKSVILLLSVLAVAAAQSARSKRQAHLGGYYPYGAPVPAEDDGSYWPGKYPDDPVDAPVVPGYPYPYAAPLPLPYAATVPAYPYHGADDGSYFPGKYGPEN